ncbi:tyrosine-type recombinase/integrase [Oceanobacillus damuensis]|uniref:hypothetical protein n=1 Tax=Oceanobacillus damuensis TaxID=937928 RepID=UPI0008353F18
MDENRYIEPSKKIFSTFIEFWFASHYRKSIKETTIANREYILKKHLIEENPFSNKVVSKSLLMI